MNIIKIFLASSAELQPDREAFKSFLFDRSILWTKQKNIAIELVQWERFIDAVSQTRLQDEYNKAVCESDIFVMLFWTKVGKYTEEEFDTAYKCFKQTNKPVIYTYFKDSPSGQPTQPSLETFRQKLEGDLGHYKTIYKNTEGLLLHFGMQLDRLSENLFAAAKPPVIAKEELLTLIRKNKLDEAFEEMNHYFEGNDDTLNALINEFIYPPNSYNPVTFVTRLKVFVNQNWP